MSSFVTKAKDNVQYTMDKQAKKPVLNGSGQNMNNHMMNIEVEDEILLIPWQIIHPDPDQPRKERDPVEFEKVSNSIKQTEGNTQPINVRKHPELNGQYMLVVGEGRWTACKEHDFKVRAILSKDYDTDKSDTNPNMEFDKLFHQVSENVGRNDLPLVREAEALQKLVNTHVDKLPAKEIGKMLGYNKTKTSRFMKLAGAPEAIKKVSLDSVSQNINVFILLMDLHELVDDETFETHLIEVYEKQLFERGLREIVRRLKQPVTEDVVTEDVATEKAPQASSAAPQKEQASEPKIDAFPLVSEALKQKDCTDKLAASIQKNLEQARDDGYGVNEAAISEHISSMTDKALPTLSNFDTLVEQCVEVYEEPPTIEQPAPPSELSLYPEMETCEVVDGFLLIYVKGQKLPLKLSKDDANTVKIAIEQL